jgi:hypothetical protein
MPIYKNNNLFVLRHSQFISRILYRHRFANETITMGSGDMDETLKEEPGSGRKHKKIQENRWRIGR